MQVPSLRPSRCLASGLERSFYQGLQYQCLTLHSLWSSARQQFACEKTGCLYLSCWLLSHLLLRFLTSNNVVLEGKPQGKEWDSGEAAHPFLRMRLGKQKKSMMATDYHEKIVLLEISSVSMPWSRDLRLETETGLLRCTAENPKQTNTNCPPQRTTQHKTPNQNQT